ncbi:hypothetical protein C8Q70DRAFT_380250 [Cubamyces menziesii]|nr:hypothetical protein C8Q70DRAFT_380250 [Cubamyces menziesii]
MDGQDTLYMQGPMAICALPGALSLSPHQQLTPERFVTALATAYFRALQSPPQPGIPNAPSNNPTPHGGPQGDPTHSQCLWTMRCLAHCESLVVHMPYGQTVELSRIARPVSVPFPVSMPLPATGVSDLALPRVMRVEVLGVAGSGVDAVAFRGRADSVPVVLKLGVRRRRREEAPPGVGYEWSRLERILPADAGEAGRLPIPSYFGLFRGMDSVEMILMSDGGVPLNSDKALSDAMQPEVERAYEMLRGVGIEPTDNNSCNVVFDGHQIRVIDFADEFHL